MAICPPTLAVVTQDQVDDASRIMAKCRVHRVEPNAVGWCTPLQAFTSGEIWFWYVGEREAHALMPMLGNPYTKREEAFHAYLESSDYH